jgi:hypothetical protein
MYNKNTSFELNLPKGDSKFDYKIYQNNKISINEEEKTE